MPGPDGRTLRRQARALLVAPFKIGIGGLCGYMDDMRACGYAGPLQDARMYGGPAMAAEVACLSLALW